MLSRIPPSPGSVALRLFPHSRALPGSPDPIKRANKRGDWVFTALCSQRGGRHSADAKNDATPAALGSQAGDAQLRRGPQLHCTRRADVRHSQLHCARRAFVHHPQLRRQRHSHRQRRRNATARCAVVCFARCASSRAERKARRTAKAALLLSVMPAKGPTVPYSKLVRAAPRAISGDASRVAAFGERLGGVGFEALEDTCLARVGIAV